MKNSCHNKVVHKICTQNYRDAWVGTLFLIDNKILESEPLVSHCCCASMTSHIIYSGTACRDGDVRLRNGNHRHEGRIEICFNETWGTICHSIDLYSWNHSQADIVCKQLGYSQAGKLSIIMMKLLLHDCHIVEF